MGKDGHHLTKLRYSISFFGVTLGEEVKWKRDSGLIPVRSLKLISWLLIDCPVPSVITQDQTNNKT